MDSGGMHTGEQRARILSEALPFLLRYMPREDKTEPPESTEPHEPSKPSE